MPLFPYINYIVLAFFAFVIVTLAFNPSTRVALFVTPVWFILLLLIYQFKGESAPDGVAEMESDEATLR